MSTKDQTFSSMLHGEALLRAKRPELDPLRAELRELSHGRHDIRTECAGTIAGGWFARPVIMGEDLIAAGLLMQTLSVGVGRIVVLCPAQMHVRPAR